MNTYRTVQGDTWDSIAFMQLGSEHLTDTLMRCNLQYLAYNIFPAGIILTLPDVGMESDDDAVPPWKRARG